MNKLTLIIIVVAGFLIVGCDSGETPVTTVSGTGTAQGTPPPPNSMQGAVQGNPNMPQAAKDAVLGKGK